MAVLSAGPLRPGVIGVIDLSRLGQSFGVVPERKSHTLPLP